MTTYLDPRFPDVTFHVSRKCVFDGGYLSSSGAGGHAHDKPDRPHYGSVCVHPDYVDDPRVRAHEAAHIRNAGRDGHGKHWRALITDLGYPEEAARYGKPKRTRCTIYRLDSHGRTLGAKSWLLPLYAPDIAPLVNEDGTVTVSPDLARSLTRWDRDGSTYEPNTRTLIRIGRHPL